MKKCERSGSGELRCFGQHFAQGEGSRTFRNLEESKQQRSEQQNHGSRSPKRKAFSTLVQKGNTSSFVKSQQQKIIFLDASKGLERTNKAESYIEINNEERPQNARITILEHYFYCVFGC